MNYLYILLSTLLSAAALFLLSKLMGTKQISQMNFFDYATGITIGSIGAELAISGSKPLETLEALVVFCVITTFISVLTNKSILMRRLFSGKPMLIYDRGVISRTNLARARMDLDDFLTLCRLAGYFELGDLESAVLEHNGLISFLPKAGKRPATPEDLSLPVKPKRAPSTVILDGNVMERALRKAGRDRRWLDAKLAELGVKSPAEVFFGSVSSDGELTVCRAKDAEKKL